MTQPDRERDRLPRVQSAVRGDVLAQGIYRDILKARRSNPTAASMTLEYLAEVALDEAAVLVRALKQRDPITCELAPHLQGLPREDGER